MPSIIPRVLQPPFSLAQLLSETDQNVNSSVLTLSATASTIVSLPYTSLSAGSILIVNASATVLLNAATTGISLFLKITSTLGDYADWYGTASVAPQSRFTVATAPFAQVWGQSIFGIALMVQDLTNVELSLQGRSSSADSTISVNNAGIRAFLLQN